MTAPTDTTAAPAQPNFRYFIEPPSLIQLKADDISPHLPVGAWTGRCDVRTFKLPTAEVLETNVPRIRLTRLCEMFPACIRPVQGAPEWVRLPAASVTLAYAPTTHRESFDESSPPASPSPVPVPIVEAAAPAPPAPTATLVTPAALAPQTTAPIPSWKRLMKPVLAPPPKDKPASPPPLLTFAERTIPMESEGKLHELFRTNGSFTAQRLTQEISAHPEVNGCEIRRGTDSVAAGTPPAKLAASALRELAIKAKASDLEPFVTLYRNEDTITFLHSGQSTLVVSHQGDGLPHHLREKLRAALDAVELAAES
jgi:hypothetical protein